MRGTKSLIETVKVIIYWETERRTLCASQTFLLIQLSQTVGGFVSLYQMDSNGFVYVAQTARELTEHISSGLQANLAIELVVYNMAKHSIVCCDATFTGAALSSEDSAKFHMPLKESLFAFLGSTSPFIGARNELTGVLEMKHENRTFYIGFGRGHRKNRVGEPQCSVNARLTSKQGDKTTIFKSTEKTAERVFDLGNGLKCKGKFENTTSNAAGKRIVVILYEE